MWITLSVFLNDWVSFSKVTYAKGPQKFEAGTPDIAGVIGFNAALQYLMSLDGVETHEQALLAYTMQSLQAIEGVRLIGTVMPKVGVVSFVMDDVHPHDIGTILDSEGVAVRAGHHCAMPLMTRFGLPATVRVSLGLYNQTADIDALVAAIHEIKRIFA